MDKMFINNIVCMKFFNNGFGKRVTNFCYNILLVINEYNTLTRWQSLTVTKLIPFRLINKKPIGFRNGNYARTL